MPPGNEAGGTRLIRTGETEHSQPTEGDAGTTALGAIGRIVKAPPAIVAEVLRADVRLTRRWGHAALHDYLGALRGHVVMTYYGPAQDITWRSGTLRLNSLTRRGSITLIPDGHDGHWDINGPIGVSHVYLTQERLQVCADIVAGGRTVELVRRVGQDDLAASRILELLSQESITADTASRLFVEQAIDLLCLQLVRGHSSFGSLAPAPPRRGLADWQLKRVTAYMREHLGQAISLEELAGLVGLSRFHFCTAFRLATGQTPHGWLTALRMGRARELLAEPQLSITDVALSVGYQTPSSFAATFRRSERVTPSEYRRAL